MHRRVVEDNKNDVGGHWDRILSKLIDWEDECCKAFTVDQNSLRSQFDDTIIRKTRTTLTMLTQVFPKCGKINDRPNAP